MHFKTLVAVEVPKLEENPISKFRGSFEIKKANGKIDDIHFDCDYVIA